MKIQTGRCIRRVTAEVERELAPFLTNRQALFLSASILEPNVAKKLIDFGIKTYSHLGKYCPISLYNGALVNPSNFGVIPFQCGDHIYFVKEKLESVFAINPAKYINQTTPLPVLASNCCIIGNQKSGKSSLAETLSKDLDAIHLTVSNILQTIIDGREITALCEKV